MDRDRLETIIDISRRMSATQTLEPLLADALGQAVDLLGAERGCIVLVQPDGKLRIPVWHTGISSDGDLPNEADQYSASIVNKVIHTAEPLILRNATADPSFKHARSVIMLNLRSVMCVPLLARGHAIGAIYLENRSVEDHFSEADLPLLLLLANQAAATIENATLNDELEARIAARTRELAQAKAALETKLDEAVEAARLRTVMLSNVVHDLRAPLTIVIATLVMLKDGEFGAMTDEQIEWLGRARDAAARALSLTNDVFDLTKIETGGLRLYKEVVNLEEFLQSVYDAGLGLPWPPNVVFQCQLPASLPDVLIDPDRIQQAITNLLSNALKFTEHGKVTLYAEYTAGESQVIVGVRDTGRGIPPDRLGKLFKRYAQFENPYDKKRQGTGLGLAISRELVEMHGGRIWAESTPGVGSDFKLTLPLYNA